MQIEYMEHIDAPPDRKLYTPFRQYNKNLLLLGTIIDNVYDHERIQINPVHKPIRIQHKDNFFYGVELEINPHFDRIMNRITSLPMHHTDRSRIYRERLKLYDLSCDQCWCHLEENIFPIDPSNIDKVSINTQCMMTDKNIVLTDNEQLPWYSQYEQLKIFLLTI